MATRTIRICDTCKATENVETFETKSGDWKVRLDLAGSMRPGSPSCWRPRRPRS
jgi:hypothetical protein